MTAVETQQDGLDKLRGFFDLGIWEGKAIKEGGDIAGATGKDYEEIFAKATAKVKKMKNQL
jgi:hypothetical protein